MKIKILLIGLLILVNIKLNAQEERIIKKEAKYYCQCYKSFNKKKQEIDRKTKRKKRRDSKPKKYKPGMKLFGGYSLDFSFGDCLNRKRSTKSIRYIESSDDKEKERFRRKVKSLIKEKHPKCNSKYY